MHFETSPPTDTPQSRFHWSRPDREAASSSRPEMRLATRNQRCVVLREMTSTLSTIQIEDCDLNLRDEHAAVDVSHIRNVEHRILAG
mmetsp:Transcript_29595/g.98060  ORF Transcript_29595/g.98060 Transcript_29595/m.98060 type:complete len:87 (-) Transcript_29595:1143-1403(-)